MSNWAQKMKNSRLLLALDGPPHPLPSCLSCLNPLDCSPRPRNFPRPRMPPLAAAHTCEHNPPRRHAGLPPQASPSVCTPTPSPAPKQALGVPSAPEELAASPERTQPPSRLRLAVRLEPRPATLPWDSSCARHTFSRSLASLGGSSALTDSARRAGESAARQAGPGAPAARHAASAPHGARPPFLLTPSPDSSQSSLRLLQYASVEWSVRAGSEESIPCVLRQALHAGAARRAPRGARPACRPQPRQLRPRRRRVRHTRPPVRRGRSCAPQRRPG